MNPAEVMEKMLHKERCDECHCVLGDDWQYVDFSNKNIIECPQCHTYYYIEY